MRRLARFLAGLLFAVLAIIVAESVTSEDADAQRKPPEMLIALRPEWRLAILEYPQPAEYEQWWRELAACEHLPLPDKHYAVQFFAVNGREFTVVNDPFSTPWFPLGWAIGYADPWSDQIYLAFPYLDEEMIVKHEMLHDLMKWASEPPSHAEERYGKPGIGKCGVVPYRREGIDEK